MKKPKPGKFTERVSFAVTADQWKTLIDGHAKSVYFSFSQHVRAMLFERKMHIYYRDQSFDDFLIEGIRLRQEMQVLSDDASISDRDGRLLILLEQIKTVMDKIFDVCTRR